MSFVVVGFRLMGSGLWWQLRCKIYICGGAATFIPNSSFEQSFHSKSRDSMSHDLSLKAVVG